MQSLATFATATLRMLLPLLFLTGAVSFLVMLKGALYLRRRTREAPPDFSLALLKTRTTPALAVAFAPNDCGASARFFARKLIALHHPNFDIVAALRAPSEDDLAAWRDEFQLEPLKHPIQPALSAPAIQRAWQARQPLRLTVLQLPPASDQEALNAAVNAADTPHIGIIEEDYDFVPQLLLRLAVPLIDNPSNVAACEIAPRGSAFVFAREAILKAGGFRAAAFDFALDSGAAVIPGAACFRRLITISRKQAAFCVTSKTLPRWLRVGMLAYHFLWPAFETAAYLLMLAALAAGLPHGPLLPIAALATLGLGALLSISALALPELAEPEPTDPAQLSRLFVAAVVENFGPRQARNLMKLA